MTYRTKTQTYNDGVVAIYDVDNAAEEGNLPQESLVFKERLRYEERTVGMRRHYAAMQAGVKVENVLRCPRRDNVSTQDIAVPNDGKQYAIRQIQFPHDVAPASMDLTLELAEKVYKGGGA